NPSRTTTTARSARRRPSPGSQAGTWASPAGTAPPDGTRPSDKAPTGRAGHGSLSAPVPAEKPGEGGCRGPAWLTGIAWLHLLACFCCAGIIAYDIAVNHRRQPMGVM